MSLKDEIGPGPVNPDDPQPYTPPEVTITNIDFGGPDSNGDRTVRPDPNYPSMTQIKLTYDLSLSGGTPPYQPLVGHVSWNGGEGGQDFNITPTGSLASGEVWITVINPGALVP